MADPLSLLRLMGRFGSMGQSTPTNPTGVPATLPVKGMGGDGGDDFDIDARLAELYHPSTMAGDRFENLVQNAPHREKVSPWRKLAVGALGGLMKSSPAEIDRSVNSNYYDKLDEFKTQIGPAQEAARLENQDNSNMRQLALQTIGQERMGRRDLALSKAADERQALGERAQSERERGALVREENARKRTSIMDYKARKPNAKFFFGGPTVLAADPETGEVTDTGLETGSMSDLEKMNLGQINAKELEAIRQKGRTSLESQRQSGKIFMSQIQKPGTAKPVTSRETQNQQYEKAQRLKNSRPEFSKYITLTPPGSFEIKSNTPKEIRDQINKEIYGISTPAKSTVPGTTTPPDTSAKSAPKVTWSPEMNKKPTKGDIRQYPNGNFAEFDGIGWVARG